MPKQYQPAIFQPTIRPSWAGSFEYISSEELSQILKAITIFPNLDLPDSAFWNQTVKPDLAQQYQSFINTCEKRGRGARTYWGEHKLSLCNTYDNHKDTTSITQGNLCKDKDKDKENKGGMGEIDFDTTFKAGGQLWTLPPNFRKLALTRYTESEIRAFEKTHSCHESLEDVCLNDIKHEPKPKATRFVKPTVEEIATYCQERGNGIDAEYFFNYYEGNGWKVGKNPMKNWQAAIRTWEIRQKAEKKEPTMSDKPLTYEELAAQRGIEC